MMKMIYPSFVDLGTLRGVYINADLNKSVHQYKQPQQQ